VYLNIFKPSYQKIKQIIALCLIVKLKEGYRRQELAKDSLRIFSKIFRNKISIKPKNNLCSSSNKEKVSLTLSKTNSNSLVKNHTVSISKYEHPKTTTSTPQNSTNHNQNQNSTKTNSYR
jgi:hypothetical protein